MMYNAVLIHSFFFADNDELYTLKIFWKFYLIKNFKNIFLDINALDFYIIVLYISYVFKYIIL